MKALDLHVDATSVARGYVERSDRSAWLSPRIVRDRGITPGERRLGASSAWILSYPSIAVVALTVHAGVFWLLAALYGTSFSSAQLAAGIAACVATYGAQEWLCYPRRGPWRWYLGLPPFLLSCAIGLSADILIASWLAGSPLGPSAAALAGAVALICWNYGVVQRHAGFGQ